MNYHEKPGTPQQVVHSGVKGMKWGVRRERKVAERRQALTTARNEALAAYTKSKSKPTAKNKADFDAKLQHLNKLGKAEAKRTIRKHRTKQLGSIAAFAAISTGVRLAIYAATGVEIQAPRAPAGLPSQDRFV